MKKFTVQKDTLVEGENVFHKHQTKIAKDTLRMHDVGVSIMGGMNKEEARTHLKKMGWSDAKIHAHEHGETPLKEETYHIHGTAQTYDKKKETWSVDHKTYKVSAPSSKAALAKSLKQLQKAHPDHAEHEVRLHQDHVDGPLSEAVSPIKKAENHTLSTASKHGLDHPKLGVAMKKLNKLYNAETDRRLDKEWKKRFPNAYKANKANLKEGIETIVEEVEPLNEIRLGIGDHRVIKSFMNKKPLNGKKLSTDGKSLSGNWLGGSGIAHHSEKGIHLNDVGSKSGQQIHHAIKKHNSYDSHSDVPHYELHEDTSLREETATHKGPRWKYQDSRGVDQEGHMERYLDHGGTDHTAYLRRDDGTLDLVSGSRLKNAKVVHSK